MQVIINIDERLISALRSRRAIIIIIPAILLLLLVGISHGSGVTWDNLNVFNRGTVISSSQVNQNFRALQSKIQDLDMRTAAVPVGTVLPWSGLSDSVPAGWMICDGRELGRHSYDSLFSVIHTIWGEGDGIHTFNIPDLRGVFLRGSNHGGKKAARRRAKLQPLFDPDADSRIWNNENPALSPYVSNREYVGSYQRDAFQGHWHQLFYRANGSGHSGKDDVVNGIDSQRDDEVRDPVSDGNHGAPRIASETRAMNAAVHFIIKVR
jgi:hypothetical protein